MTEKTAKTFVVLLAVTAARGLQPHSQRIDRVRLDPLQDDFAKILEESKALDVGVGESNLVNNPSWQKAAAEMLAQGPTHNLSLSLINGDVRLLKALSVLYGKLNGREVDPMTELVVSIGSTQAITAGIQVLINPGDEVIIIQPGFYYIPAAVQLSGGVPVFLNCESPYGTPTDGIGLNSSDANDWKIDFHKLRSLVTSKTKLIAMTTPSNPTGKVFSKDELEKIAKICVEFDLYVLVDEVYEFLTYPDSQHTRISSLPGMWNRTVVASSASKAFFQLGWRIGWAIGPQHIISRMKKLILISVYWAPNVYQHAMAAVIESFANDVETNRSWLTQLMHKEVMPARDQVVSLLTELGLTPVVPHGAMFITANLSPLVKYVDLKSFNCTSEYPIAEWFSRVAGIHVLPAALFFGDTNSKKRFQYGVRITYMKKRETVDELLKRLRRLKSLLRRPN